MSKGDDDDDDDDDAAVRHERGLHSVSNRFAILAAATATDGTACADEPSDDADAAGRAADRDCGTESGLGDRDGAHAGRPQPRAADRRTARRRAHRARQPRERHRDGASDTARDGQSASCDDDDASLPDRVDRAREPRPVPAAISATPSAVPALLAVQQCWMSPEAEMRRLFGSQTVAAAARSRGSSANDGPRTVGVRRRSVLRRQCGRAQRPALAPRTVLTVGTARRARTTTAQTVAGVATPDVATSAGAAGHHNARDRRVESDAICSVSLGRLSGGPAKVRCCHRVRVAATDGAAGPESGRNVRSFWRAIDSFDANQVRNLLFSHPYHVDSLLQLSDVAADSGDMALAGELIEVRRGTPVLRKGRHAD